jgi:uncharacterized protein YciI
MNFRDKSKKIAVILLVLLTNFLTLHAQSDNSKYNKHLADSLGADEYGMKMYVLVLLKSGENKTTNQITIDSLFSGHMQNINRLVKIGKLIVAGPLQKNEKDYRGIFILDVKTIKEAKSLLETDPAIHAKLLATELYNWYGSAALPMYLPASEKVTEKSF